jgi:hypothetical protein
MELHIPTASSLFTECDPQQDHLTCIYSFAFDLWLYGKFKGTYCPAKIKVGQMWCRSLGISVVLGC